LQVLLQLSNYQQLPIMDKEIKADKELIAYCGLYCGACRKRLMKKCPGCQKNEKAGWCKTRKCCQENGYCSCANCKMDVAQCGKFSNFISKIFALLFKSDRKACIERIKEIGEEEYAKEMSEKKIQTIKR